MLGLHNLVKYPVTSSMLPVAWEPCIPRRCSRSYMANGINNCHGTKTSYRRCKNLHTRTHAPSPIPQIWRVEGVDRCFEGLAWLPGTWYVFSGTVQRPWRRSAHHYDRQGLTLRILCVSFLPPSMDIGLYCRCTFTFHRPRCRYPPAARLLAIWFHILGTGFHVWSMDGTSYVRTLCMFVREI